MLRSNAWDETGTYLSNKIVFIGEQILDTIVCIVRNE